FVQSVKNLHAVNGNLAECHRYLHGNPGLGLQAKQAQRGTGLPVSRAADVQYVVEALDENGPVYREVGARTRRQVSEDLDVDLHGTVDDRRVDAGNTAFDDAVPRIHVHGLAKADVLGLRFGDAQLGHQLVRPCHPRDVRAGYHSLPGLDFQRLQHAFDACPDVEIGQEVLAHREVLFLLVYSRAGCPEPSVQRILQVLDALPFNVEAHLQLFGRKFNAPVVNCGNDSLRRYLGSRFRLHACALVFRVRGGNDGALVQNFGSQLHLERGVIGFGGRNLGTDFEHLLLEFRVAHLDQHRVLRDLRARLHEHPVDTRFARRGDPADFARHQYARTTDLQQHFPAFDGIYIECRPLDRRRRRLEHRQEDYERQHHRRRASRVRPALAFAFLFQVVSDEIHLCVAERYKSGRPIARCMPSAKPAKPRAPGPLRTFECPEMEQPDRKWD